MNEGMRNAYREPDVATPAGPRTGYEPKFRHRCRRPGLIARHWQGIGAHGLWRCECGAVWECMSALMGWYDTPVPIERWTAAGGSE